MSPSLRPLLCALLLARPLGAQQLFIAPTNNNILASSEESYGSMPAHILYVRNQSTVPIVVFGLSLSDCENVRQSCGGSRIHVVIGPGQQRQVGRVDVKSTEHSLNYRWTFSYEADSSDAAAVAVLKEHGLDLFGRPVPHAQPGPVFRVDTAQLARMLLDSIRGARDRPVTVHVLTDSERTANVINDGSARSVVDRPTMRFKVAYGSILGSTMMVNAPVQVTGPCINPQDATRIEADKTITRAPWRPATMGMNASVVSRPKQLKDSTLSAIDPLARFVVDTTGEVIPESISIMESPHGLVSAEVCKRIMQSTGKPARDKNGHPIRAWLQMTVRLLPPSPLD